MTLLQPIYKLTFYDKILIDTYTRIRIGSSTKYKTGNVIVLPSYEIIKYKHAITAAIRIETNAGRGLQTTETKHKYINNKASVFELSVSESFRVEQEETS